MPPPSVCAKCRQIPAAQGDSWCSGCSAWEFVGKELTASWDSQGARLLASDLIVGAARQIKALRSLSSGLTRESGGKGAAGSNRAASERVGEDRMPRRRSVPSAPPPPPAKEEELSDELEEETEEETEGEGHREVAPLASGGHNRPPEPEGPPPSKERRGDHRRDHRGEPRDRRRDKEKSGKRKSYFQEVEEAASIKSYIGLLKILSSTFIGNPRLHFGICPFTAGSIWRVDTWDVCNGDFQRRKRRFR